MLVLGPSKTKTRTGLPTQTKVIAPLPINLPSTSKPDGKDSQAQSSAWGSNSTQSTESNPPSSTQASNQTSTSAWSSNKLSPLKQDSSSSGHRQQDEYQGQEREHTNGSNSGRYYGADKSYGSGSNSRSGTDMSIFLFNQN
jgi:hypothetical protein